jgi:hypothetical protein
MIKTRIAIIIAIAMIGVLVNSTAIPKTYAAGGLMSLVAHGSQDVYLTGNPTVKLKFDVNRLQSHLAKLRSEENKSQSSGGVGNFVASSSQDVNELQSDINKLQSEENKLKSDMTELQSEENKNSSPK